MIESNLDRRPVSHLRTQVLVVGGGAAGVAAATTAARQGVDVVLVERYGFCGGGAVAGMSGTVCGLYLASDRDTAPRQLVFGFADEFVSLLEERNGLAPAVKYGKTFTRVHDPLVWRETADQLLRAAGVRIVFHALATSVNLDGDRVVGVNLYTKQGPFRIDADITIDASGDADLAAMAGLPSVIGDNGRVQNPTMIFRLLGVDTGKFEATYGTDTIMPPKVSEMIADANGSGNYRLPRSKIWLFATPRPGELLCNCTRVTGADGRELNTLIADDFTDAELEGRLQVREYARFFREYLAGCEMSFVNDTGTQVGVRQTRQIVGVERLGNNDVVRGTKSAHGIAISPWPIELHSGAKPKVEWLLDDYYEVPFGCFVPERGEGLLFAGRCLSAEHEAVASARVTAQCFSYGHAVGHAAVLAARERVGVRQIAASQIRDILNRDGARLDG